MQFYNGQANLKSAATTVRKCSNWNPYVSRGACVLKPADSANHILCLLFWILLYFYSFLLDVACCLSVWIYPTQ